MAVFFVHDVGRGYVTPLPRKYSVREIPTIDELEAIAPSDSVANLPYTPDQTSLKYGAEYQQIQTQTQPKPEHQARLISGVASDYMSTTVVSISIADTLYDAWNEMRLQGINHIAIVDEQGALWGVVNRQDLLDYLFTSNSAQPTTKFSQLPARTFLSSAMSTQMYELAIYMLERDQDSIAITEGGLLRGLITINDVLKAALGTHGLLEQTQA